MTTLERAQQRLVVRSGSTTLTVDRDGGKVTMQRRLLFWTRRPMERRLTDIASIRVDANVDRASGVELCSITLIMRDGSAWALPHTDRNDATQAAAGMRNFLGMAA